MWELDERMVHESFKGMIVEELADVYLGHEAEPNEVIVLKHLQHFRSPPRFRPVTEQRWRGFHDLHQQRNQRDESGEDHVTPSASLNQPPNKPNIEQGAKITGNGLMALRHRYIGH